MRTTTTGLHAGPPLDDAFLTLDLEEQHICINHELPSVTIGRDSENRIVIDNPKVSRMHARVEMRQAKFILVDQSTNGTFILPDGGTLIHLLRDEMPLEGEGVISPGRKPNTKGSAVIRYCSLI